MVNPASATNLQLLVPGETTVPGSPTGKTGTPDGDLLTGGIQSFVAGTTFTVTVNSVDPFYNKVLTTNAQVHLVTTDTHDIEPADLPLTSGTTAFQVTFITKNLTGWTVHVSTVSGDLLADDQSPLLPTDANQPTKIMVTMPGLTLDPGNVGAGGLSGSPQSAVAGTIFWASATITDNFYNPVGAPGSGKVWFLTSDPYDVDGSTNTLVNGTTSFCGVSMITAGSQSLSMYPFNPGQYSTGTVNNILITAAPPRITSSCWFRANLPPPVRRREKPERRACKQPARPFGVTVNAVDQFFNLVSTNPLVNLNSGDHYGTPSDTVALDANAWSPAPRPSAVTLRTAQDASAVAMTTVTFTVSNNNTSGDTSPNLTMKANTAAKLQMLVPGETFLPGSPTGKSGSPSAAIAGENYLVTVRMTDTWFNAVGHVGATDGLTLATNDPFAPNYPDTSQSFVTGLGTFTVTYNHPLQTANSGGWTLTVSTRVGPLMAPASDGPIVVTPDTLTGGIHTHQLIALLPGETYTPGNTRRLPGGRTGSPFVGVGLSTPLAGQFFPVTVIGTDRFYNQIFDAQNPPVTISANAALFPAYKSPAPNFTVNSGSFTISAALQSSTTTAKFFVTQTSSQTYSYFGGTTTVFAVNQSSATQLQLLVPGESPVPGLLTGTPGKTGTPDADLVAGSTQSFVAGATYFATVNAVDNFYNLVSTAAAQVAMTVNDPYALMTNVQQNLQGGTTVFVFQFLTANLTGWNVTVSTVSGANIASSQSPLLPVVPSTPTTIMVTVPGVSLFPGDTAINGSSGTPIAQTAGTLWYATATITDSYYNPVGNAGTGSVWFHTSDPYDVDGATNTLSGGTTNFAVQMFQASDANIEPSIAIRPHASIPRRPLRDIPITAGTPSAACSSSCREKPISPETTPRSAALEKSCPTIRSRGPRAHSNSWSPSTRRTPIGIRRVRRRL